MSFISGRNFLGPFTNKTHLFSIIVLSLLFGVYRWAGGTVQVTPQIDLRREAREVQPSQSSRTPSEPRRIAPPVDEDDILKNLLRGEDSEEEPKAEKTPSKDRLNDIKRQLGL